jgi:hypothetical protein
VWQKEETKDGTPHWQGYLELNKKVRYTAIHKIIGTDKKTHVERRKGTREQARAYCMKEDTRVDGPYESGAWTEGKGQGYRSDLAAALECKTLKEIKENHAETYVRYHRGLEKLLIGEHRKDAPKIIILWGEGSGTGKTSSVKKWCEKMGLEYYMKDSGPWWQGYGQEPVVIMDEFEKGFISAELFKRIGDIMPLEVPIKGSSMRFNSQFVFVTSNYDPKEWFDTRIWNTIYRRISLTIYCGKIDRAYEDRVEEIEVGLIEPWTT